VVILLVVLSINVVPGVVERRADVASRGTLRVIVDE
jgi:hypothetical protein